MCRIRLVVLLLCLLSGICGQGNYHPYDCRRSNSGCLNGGQCDRISNSPTRGNCTCPLASGWTGYDCGFVAALANSAGCFPACQNGGTCFRPSTTSAFRCYCPEQWSGPSCNQMRVRIMSCTPTTMTAVINPHSSNFAGRVYVKGHQANSACRFTRSGDAQNPGYTRQLSLDTTAANPCSGSQSLVPTTLPNGLTKKTYTVVVEHSPFNILVYTDEEHTLSCTGNPSGSNSVTLGTVNIIPGGTIGGTNANGDIAGQFNLRLTTFPGRDPVTGAVMVGTDLYLEATPVNAAAIPDFRITSCTAIGPSSQRVNLIANRCIADGARGIGVMRLLKSGNVASIQFKAFKFNNAASMQIACEFDICTTVNDARCSLTQCAGGTELNYGRRRREASTEKQANSSIRVYVVSSLHELDEPRRQCEISSEDVCFHIAAVITVVSLFLLLLVLVLVMLVFVCLRLRKQKATKEVTVFSNDYVNNDRM